MSDFFDYKPQLYALHAHNVFLYHLKKFALHKNRIGTHATMINA